MSSPIAVIAFGDELKNRIEATIQSVMFVQECYAKALSVDRAALTKGNIVTTPRSDMMYVVTEYGMVNLKGRTVAERAQLLISIAHPDFREDLSREAHQHNLIPRGYF